MTIYEQLMVLVEKYLKGDHSPNITEQFCNNYMELYENTVEELYDEVTHEQYCWLDYIFLACDSYEYNIQIREDDKNTIGEIELVEEIKKYMGKLNSIEL